MNKKMIALLFLAIVSRYLAAAEVIEVKEEQPQLDLPEVWIQALSAALSEDVSERAMALEGLYQFLSGDGEPVRKSCCPKKNMDVPLLNSEGDAVWDAAICAQLPQKSTCGFRRSRDVRDWKRYHDRINCAALLYIAKMMRIEGENGYIKKLHEVVENIKIFFPANSQYVKKYLVPLLQYERREGSDVETLVLQAMAHRLRYLIEEVDGRRGPNFLKVEFYVPPYTPDAVLDLALTKAPQAVRNERAYKKRMKLLFALQLFVAFMPFWSSPASFFYYLVPQLEMFGLLENPLNILVWLIPLVSLSIAQDCGTEGFCQNLD